MIERAADEKALPVTTLYATDIQASGATSLPDLVRKLSFAQGATGESSSVGGESFGFSGISLHNVGENRTLVLLNGRRLAQFGGQNGTGFGAAFDLNSIPLAAIEQIQLLTDGASSVYGADAIGGVVNIITKREGTDGDVSLGASVPRGGATEKRFSATKGWNLQSRDDKGEGANLRLTFGHDQRTALAATDRSFARSGQVEFSSGGKRYQAQNLSLNAAPANVFDDQFQYVSPFRVSSGACAPGSFRVVSPYIDAFGTPLVDDYCGQDFVRELEIFPERKRDNFMASFTHGDPSKHQLFADVLLSRTSQVSRIAGVPGELFIGAGTPLHNQYLLPIGITLDTTAYYRASDLGRRTTRDTADFAHVAFGSKGKLDAWDYELGYSHSQSDVKSRISGYPGGLAMQALVDNGLLDPFVGPGQQTPAAQAALAAAGYSGYWNGGTSRLDTLGLSGKRDLGELPGGKVRLATGAQLAREHFTAKPSLFAQGRLADPVAGTLCDGAPATCDLRFGEASQTLPYSAGRTSGALFGELALPVTRTLELGTSLRFDHYSDFGTATTGKANFRWLPTGSDSLLLRGSIGNGFHAPTVPQVKAARMSGGFTSAGYDCTPELLAVANALGTACRGNGEQYGVLFAGNPALQAEKSKQATLGFRLEPSPAFTFGADLWHVQIANRIGQLSEDVVFANPGAFPNAWVADAASGFLAFLQDNRNLGKSYATGIDLDFATEHSIPGWGQLTSNFSLTQVLREVAQLEKGGRYYSSVGNFSDLGTVTFRTQGRMAFALRTSDRWAHTLAINFKSGYRDKVTTVNLLDATGAVVGTEDLRLHVKSYATVDWQTEWTSANKAWRLNAGVLNLFNRAPSFSASSSGLDRGLQYGYDDRYYDPRGRTIFVDASYKF